MSDDPRPIAVLDIDGVLADVRHRLHHIAARPKDWRSFFAAASDDPALPEGLAVAAELGVEHTIAYVTGRPERLRRTTQEWLRRHDLPPGRLLMRRGGDYRPAREVKLEALRAFDPTSTIAVVVDDDDSVVAALRNAGFTVFHATWSRPDDTLHDAQERDGQT
jgi:beta-phosphoglucomutase-like phosphatase (HAD superfamily)